MVEKQLKRCGYEYYTHDKPNERPYRVVLRGMPLVDPTELLDRLKKEHNIIAQAAYIIKRKGECATLDESFYLLHFAKGYTNLKKLRDIKHVAHIIVRWESYHNKRGDVTQCMNCLFHGHGTRNCHLKSRFNNCGESHATEKCPKKNTPTKRCANCNGAHPATDRSCPKRAEYIQIRQKATISNQPGRKETKKSANAPALSMKDFPALPNPVPTVPQIGSQPSVNAGTDMYRNLDPRTRANSIPAEASSGENKEELYSSAQLWTIFTEFCSRLRQCKTRSDQVKVLGYMVCQYGVN